MKKCTKCGEDKELEEYSFRGRDKKAYRAHCKTCQRDYDQSTRNFKPDPMLKTKVCTGCKEEQGINQFSKNIRSLGGYTHTCKECMRNRYLERVYGVSIDEYHSMLLEQEHSCWICKIHSDEHCKENLHVDHDHSTGEVRGLLCENCNLMLGHARDNKVVLENAIKYLNK